MVKVCGYLLGEFGHLISANPQSSPMAMLQLLQSKWVVSTLETRALLLSSYIKLVNLFPELKPTALPLIQANTGAFDAEIQQRAVEYSTMAGLPTSTDLLSKVWDAMPNFPERQNALLKRMEHKDNEGAGSLPKYNLNISYI